jgi:hypothetical protein
LWFNEGVDRSPFVLAVEFRVSMVMVAQFAAVYGERLLGVMGQKTCRKLLDDVRETTTAL